MCKSQHKELCEFCFPQLLKEMAFISLCSSCTSELLLPPIIHILCIRAMAGPPAFRSGHLLEPQLWGSVFHKEIKVCIAAVSRGSGTLVHM